MSSRVMLLMVVGSLIVASCGGGESTETTQSGVGTTTSSTTTTVPSTTTTVPETTMVEAAPFHAIPDDAVAVTGTATCVFSRGGGFLTVECVLDMSDPRVSGNEIHPDLRFFAEGAGGRVWVTEEAVITNDGGTWRGSAQAAEDLARIPSGEAHYVGEGGYEGLVFHYYFFHPDLADKAELRGWISGGG